MGEWSHFRLTLLPVRTSPERECAFPAMVRARTVNKFCYPFIRASIVTVFIIVFIEGILLLTAPETSIENVAQKLNESGRHFAVFACSTPDQKSHRAFDYAFYLPLTALAWRRIGFESIVLIIGEKSEWKNHPILSYTLESLNALPHVTVLFISANVENRGMLSQTARMFLANMDAFPGVSTDHIMTTDADLWPLRKEHYYVPQGIDRSLILVHSKCCAPFDFAGRSYPMFPMCNIGASAATWRQIINTNSSVVAKDPKSILKYFESFFGERVHRRVEFASDDWYLDQNVVSIRIDEWIRRHGTKDPTYRVSDVGFGRIDRMSWNPQRIRPSNFKFFFDAHLIEEGFIPKKWLTIRPLLHLMYNKSSWQTNWSNNYAAEFHTRYADWKAKP